MSSIGIGELAVICIVLILAVGPERLPQMMKTFGKTVRTLRQASRDIRTATGIDEMMREDFDLNAPPKRKPLPPPGPAPISRAPEALPPAAAGSEVPVASAEPVAQTTPAIPSATEAASAATTATEVAPSDQAAPTSPQATDK